MPTFKSCLASLILRHCCLGPTIRDARRGNLETRSSPITSLQRRMNKRHYSLQSGSSGIVSIASRGSLSRKKATHPTSRKTSESSSMGSANPKTPTYYSLIRKDRDLPKAYYHGNDERIRRDSKDSVVEVLCPLKSDTDTSPETAKDLVGEYRRRLYKKGDADNAERQKESQSGGNKLQVTLHLQKDVGQKTAKVSRGVRKPAHYLQFPCQYSVSDNNQDNEGPVLEQLMTDIVKRIQSYESGYYRGFWCDKNSFFRSRSKSDKHAHDKTHTPPVSSNFIVSTSG